MNPQKAGIVMSPELFSLPNGIRVVHLHAPHTRVVHCGMVIQAGSRDESPDELGIAHFIEHMIFKGTSRRKNFHILNYLESVGGDLDAYTTKERTILYATLPAAYLERAIELLADITFESTFPEKEIEKERQVISEEIDMYQENPEDTILEQFDRVCFDNHPLAHPIPGTRDSIQSFNKGSFTNFMLRNFTQNRIVLGISGNVDRKKAERLALKHLGHRHIPADQPRLQAPLSYKPLHTVLPFSTSQAHQVIGGMAYPFRQSRYMAFALLTHYLGGPANYTLLNFNIRERYGLSYNIYAFYSPYSDVGNWGIYYACEPGSRARIRQLVYRELAQLRNKKIGTVRMNQIRRQAIGQLTLSDESLLGRMLVSAQNYLDFDRDFSLEEQAKRIEAIRAEDLLEAANECFLPDLLSEVTFLPENGNGADPSN